MHNTDPTKDDIIETGLELLFQALDYIKKSREAITEKFTEKERQDGFKELMQHVIDKTENEDVKSLAKSFQEDPETGMKIYGLMADKVKLIGMKESNLERTELISALDHLTEKIQKSNTPNENLQKEVDKLRGIESTKLMHVNQEIERFEKLKYDSISHIQDDKLKAFIKLAEDFESIEKMPKIVESMKGVYDKMIEQIRNKGINIEKNEVKDNEQDKPKETEETRKETEGTGQHSEKKEKEKSKEIQLDR